LFRVKNLNKYVRVSENTTTSILSNENWQAQLTVNFNKVLKSSGNNDMQFEDLRLMSTFIAKTRWNTIVKDVSKDMLRQFAATPAALDSLHKIIECGKKYIHSCCEKMKNGYMIQRRKLMCAKCISIYSN
jgi:hypothetical protein